MDCSETLIPCRRFAVTFFLQPLQKAEDQIPVYFCNCQLFRQKVLLVPAVS